MRNRVASVMIASTFMVSAQAAQALTTITTSSFGIFSSIQAVTAVGVTVGPVATASGLASPGYSVSNNVVSLGTNVDLGVLALVRAGLALNTGVLTANAAANGVAPGDTTAGNAEAIVNDIDLGLFTRVGTVLPVTVNSFALTADTITSSSTVTRVGNVGVVTGQAVYENLDLSVLSLLNFGLGANAQVGANTVLLDTLGLRLVLNEQLVTGNNTISAAITTNAVRATFDDFLLGGRLVNGEIIIGQSRATISIDPVIGGGIVPEPGVWLQMIAGFGLAGLVVRRRRAAALVPARI